MAHLCKGALRCSRALENDDSISLRPTCWSRGKEKGEITRVTLTLTGLLLSDSLLGTEQVRVIYDSC